MDKYSQIMPTDANRGEPRWTKASWNAYRLAEIQGEIDYLDRSLPTYPVDPVLRRAYLYGYSKGVYRG